MAYINKQMLTAVVADEHGNIFELEGYAAAGMSGNDFFILTKSGTCPMPHGSELMMLPDRAPIVFNPLKPILSSRTSVFIRWVCSTPRGM